MGAMLALRPKSASKPASQKEFHLSTSEARAVGSQPINSARPSTESAENVVSHVSGVCPFISKKGAPVASYT